MYVVKLKTLLFLYFNFYARQKKVVFVPSPGRSIQSLHLSPVQTHLLLTAYGPVKEQGKAGSKVSSKLGGLRY